MRTRKSGHSRRTFLQLAGLGGLASLAAPRFATRTLAAPDGPPMRLITLYTQHGVVYDGWRMRQPGLPEPEDAAWEFGLGGLAESEFSESLRPLWRHRNKMLVIDGLSLAIAMADPYGDGHAKGWNASLTGAIARETFEEIKSNASQPSLDQIVAQALRQSDPTLTDLASLEYGNYSWDFHAAMYRTDPSGGPVVRVPHEESPRAAYNRLFPNGDGSAPPDPVTGGQSDVLGRLGEMYASASSRLSAEDRLKLEAHRDLIADMKKRIDFLANLDCSAPTITEYGWDQVPHPERYMAHQRSFFDLITVALSCRVSRVATMLYGPMPIELMGGAGDLHHDYAHRSAPNLVNEPDYAAARQGMVNYTRVYSELTAELCDKLDAIPDEDGTLLDNTIIFWAGELANGGHWHDPWPAVILGGGKRFRTGRYLKYAKETLTTELASWVNENETIGLPHNHLLVSIAQAMGLDVNHVGQASVQPKKSSAPAIDLTGPLPNLV